MEGLSVRRDTFSRNTRARFKPVFDALGGLMTPPNPPDPPKRSIGFALPDNTVKKASTSARRKR